MPPAARSTAVPSGGIGGNLAKSGRKKQAKAISSACSGRLMTRRNGMMPRVQNPSTAAMAVRARAAAPPRRLVSHRVSPTKKAPIAAPQSLILSGSSSAR